MKPRRYGRRCSRRSPPLRSALNFWPPSQCCGAPDYPTLEEITDSVLRATHQHYSECLRAYQAEAAGAEYQAWKVRLAANCGCNGTVSARLKGQRLAQSSSLPVQGCPTFVPSAIFHEVTTYWRPIMEAADGGVSSAFKELVDTHVVPAEDLAAAAASFKASSSPGYDNWQGLDLKTLPLPAWEQLAAILNEVEVTRCWPDELLHSWTALIPKVDEPMSPNDLRPIRVLPTVYRLWSSARLGSVMQHLDPLLPPEILAYRPGKDLVTFSQ
eukprot:5739753-Amphidinium_carterae.1